MNLYLMVFIRKLENSLEINIDRNIYRIQAYASIMCGCFYSGFIDFILKGKSLLECTNLFFSNQYKKC